MGSEIRDTTNRVALDFNVGAKHLTDQWLQTSKLDDEQLVIGLMRLGSKQKVGYKGDTGSLLTARFPNAALAARCTSVS
jgi:hypothetical protein